jgi:exonuclease III
MKFIALNIEKNKHIEVVLEFLKKEKPSVVCIQEIFLNTFEIFKKELNMFGVFCHLKMYKDENSTLYSEGIAIFSLFPIINCNIFQYSDNDNIVDTTSSFDVLPEDEKHKRNINKEYNRKLLVVEIEKDNKKWSIATTHFTWAYYGYVDKDSKRFIWDIKEVFLKEQKNDLDRLLKILDNLGEFIFTADLNAPRGGIIFDTIAKRYKDNIPDEYKTSIDQNLHRVKGLQLMVDCLFTTINYKADNVRLVDALSDHMAIVADVVLN